MRLIALDHIVLTVSDLDAACSFYRDILGMEHVVFGGGRHALHFGGQKINLHVSETKASPKARLTTPGSADLCFLVEDLDAAMDRLTTEAVPVEEGPVYRTGAKSSLLSVYIRDPDGNLIELSQPQDIVIAPRP
ncbi:VOC family protein [Flexibacterium corallicola]|uniref:VOC family protein n=1 Tax=Flexibacterium corallicola TaxID=3037259 RepID=UPI00286F1750|nr:VOC family protein [Pseudovibrio sp. M1P-2-3]